MTERAGTEFYPTGKRHLANRPSNEALARILTAKRCFPQKADPELLTWMEQLMISHLNKSDPVTWSAGKQFNIHLFFGVHILGNMNFQEALVGIFDISRF